MSVAISSPVTGSAQTGLTSPTFTLVADIGPNSNSIQYAVSALGGTQTGVEAHTTSKPFTITIERPTNVRVLGRVNPVTGALGSVPRNTYKVRVRKGVEPLAGQAYVVASAEVFLNIPAGADDADPESCRSMISLLIGSLSQISAGLGDTSVTNIL